MVAKRSGSTALPTYTLTSGISILDKILSFFLKPLDSLSFKFQGTTENKIWTIKIFILRHF